MICDAKGSMDTGRQGLPAEAVLRAALLKQYRQLSYQELAFHLEDSASFRAFARLPHGWSPKKSVLQKTISAIRAATWEDINQAVLGSAREEKLERGRVIRIDSTATAALMHEPSDSSLLWDAVRVMVRLLQEAEMLSAKTAIFLAESSTGGEEAGAGDRVWSQQSQASPAVSGPDHHDQSDLGVFRGRRGKAGNAVRAFQSSSGRPRSSTIYPSSSGSSTRVSGGCLRVRRCRLRRSW